MSKAKIKKHKLFNNRTSVKTIKELMELLKLFPENYQVGVYEGEVCGIRIDDEEGNEIDFIRC